MVIECPSCHTKFAVDGQQLAEVENPRFHCSRCNHFFEMPENDPKSTQTELFSAQDVEPAFTAGLEPPPEELEQERFDETEAVDPFAGSLLGRDDLGSDASGRSTAPTGRRSVIAQPADDTSVDTAETLYAHPAPLIHSAARAAEPTPPQPKEERPPKAYDLDDIEMLSMVPDKDLTGEQLELLPEKEKRAQARRRLDLDPQQLLDEDEGLPLVTANWPDKAPAGEYQADFSHLHERDRRNSDAAFGSSPAAPLSSLSSGYESAGAFSWSAPTAITVEDDGGEPEPQQRVVPERFSEVLPDEQDAFSLSPGWVTDLQQEPAESWRTGSSAWGGGSSEPDEQEKVFSFKPSKRAERRSLKRKRPVVEVEPLEEPELPPRFVQSPRRSGWKAVALTCSVPLLFTLTLWGWSRNVANTPQTLAKLLHLDSRDLPKLPPPGLAMVGVSSEVVHLDDGTKVLEIRGDLLNATLQEYGEIKLEAKLYDKENRELDKLIVDMNNGLSTARLNALRPETIVDLQQRTSTAESVLKPSMKSSFRIVLPHLTGKEEWYSARIFSVI